MLYRVCRFLLNVIYTLLFRLKAEGLDNIPVSGPVLLCSNHISLLDPPTVGIRVGRKVHYMAKAELFAFKPFGAFLRELGAFPVKRGGVSKESIKLSLHLLKDGHVMGIFPEGTRSASSEGGMGKKGAAMLALRSGAVVIPVAIVGRYRLFRRTVIRYGKPVDLSAFRDGDGTDPVGRATDLIMKRIYELAAGKPRLPV
ncbi:MAG TPA: lysophospholipid acyltransferase family protein [Paenibacillus sp.]|uniref:lysophospholipid acyltransferase family protein n=1 Tax=Paenibacillus sp. TaxID=58172 RepID=UPI002BEFC222|nr:lysophospholipid acyltransferase family protein [Paenibacillus sp.]HUC92364.1 lysophospholipid acyltransferase family protein [Paenibacillus sp.]